jgi:hypothetical protein
MMRGRFLGSEKKRNTLGTGTGTHCSDRIRWVMTGELQGK